MFDLLRNRRRLRLRDTPLPPELAAWVDRNVEAARLLTAPERRELDGLVQVFLAEKTFEGAGGLTVTDEMRVTIAAEACLLLIGRDHDWFPELETILIYPHAYRAPASRRDGAVVIDGEQTRLGESWQRGLLVLAWDHVLSGTRNMHDGENVVLHEFAHQLDAEDGQMDGTPDLGRRDRYARWARVLGREYEELRLCLAHGKSSDIDAYAATNPAEFFAVVSELFFEKPVQLQNKHPDLYAEFAAFYRRDLAARVRAERR